MDILPIVLSGIAILLAFQIESHIRKLSIMQSDYFIKQIVNLQCELDKLKEKIDKA